jgi:SnoaL-like domain
VAAPETPVDQVLTLVELWNGGDVDGWLDQVDPDLCFRPDPSFPDSGWMRGEAFHRWMKEWAQTWQGNRLELLERPSQHGNAFVARARWHLTALQTGSEVPVQDFTFVFWQNEAGRLVRFAGMFDHDEALAMAGYREDEVEAAF